MRVAAMGIALQLTNQITTNAVNTSRMRVVHMTKTRS